MAIEHKKVRDFIPIAKGMTLDAFCARYDHPFLFGREVLEEEFRFQTLVTEAGPTRSAEERRSTDVFRIRHWIIPVKKPEGMAGQDRVFLGRAESNDICVPHKTVSKLHGYFARDPGVTTRWFVVDTGSANGTKHNGLRLAPRARAALVDGDTVNFGRCVFQWMTARSLYERLLAMSPERDADADRDPYTLDHD